MKSPEAPIPPLKKEVSPSELENKEKLEAALIQLEFENKTFTVDDFIEHLKKDGIDATPEQLEDAIKFLDIKLGPDNIIWYDKENKTIIFGDPADA